MATPSLLLSLFCLCAVSEFGAGQQCREDWHYYGGSCYGFGESPVTWGDAQELCIASNGKLAEIETAEENAFLKNIVRNRRVLKTWIGATDIFLEGTMEWVSSGEKVQFTDWGPGQPDNTNHEDCLTFFQTINYQWNDENCGNNANFLCEAPPTNT